MIIVYILKLLLHDDVFTISPSWDKYRFILRHILHHDCTQHVAASSAVEQVVQSDNITLQNIPFHPVTELTMGVDSENQLNYSYSGEGV